MACICQYDGLIHTDICSKIPQLHLKCESGTSLLLKMHFLTSNVILWPCKELWAALCELCYTNKDWILRVSAVFSGWPVNIRRIAAFQYPYYNTIYSARKGFSINKSVSNTRIVWLFWHIILCIKEDMSRELAAEDHRRWQLRSCISNCILFLLLWILCNRLRWIYAQEGRGSRCNAEMKQYNMLKL